MADLSFHHTPAGWFSARGTEWRQPDAHANLEVGAAPEQASAANAAAAASAASTVDASSAWAQPDTTQQEQQQQEQQQQEDSAEEAGSNAQGAQSLASTAVAEHVIHQPPMGASSLTYNRYYLSPAEYEEQLAATIEQPQQIAQPQRA